MRLEGRTSRPPQGRSRTSLITVIVSANPLGGLPRAGCGVAVWLDLHHEREHGPAVARLSGTFLPVLLMLTSRTKLHLTAGTCHGTLLRQEAAPNAPLLAFIHGGGCSSRYFETPQPSPAGLAEAGGFQVLLIDRPGHGQSGPATLGRPILSSLPAIHALIEAALEAVPRCRDLLLVGHSIGGAVALMLAAEPRLLPIRAIAVSGIGDEPPPLSEQWAKAEPSTAITAEEIASSFFGERGSYDWRGPARLRRAAESWNSEEVREILRYWPGEWPGIGARIALPVHYRLADRDGIWVSGLEVVQRFAQAMSLSPEVDAARLTEGGHVYEFHLKGHELVRSQLAFLARFTSVRHMERRWPRS